MDKRYLGNHRLRSQIADRVVACVYLWWKDWRKKIRWGANPEQETPIPGASESYHLPFFSPLYLPSLDITQTHPLTSCNFSLFKHTRKKDLIPVSAVEPCLPSVAKWKLYRLYHCLYCISIRLVYSQPGTVQTHRETELIHSCWGPICHQYTSAQSADDSLSLMSLNEMRRTARVIN